MTKPSTMEGLYAEPSGGARKAAPYFVKRATVVVIYETSGMFGETTIMGGYERGLRKLGCRVVALDRSAILSSMALGRHVFVRRFVHRLREAKADFILSCNLNGSFIFSDSDRPGTGMGAVGASTARGQGGWHHEAPAVSLYDWVPVTQVVTLNDLLDRFVAEPSAKSAAFGALLTSRHTLFLPHRENDAARIRDRGRPARHMLMGFDGEVKTGPARRELDIVFVGTVGPEGGRRHRYLERLSRLGLHLFSGRPDAAVRVPPLSGCYRGGLPTTRSLYRAYRRAKICVDLNDEEGMIPTRVFEAMGNGALVLAPRKEEILNYFEPDRHFAAYTNEEEMADRASYYLRHESARKTLAEAGRRRVREAHTYLERSRGLLKFVSAFSGAREPESGRREGGLFSKAA